jgi:hypothetical protein
MNYSPDLIPEKFFIYVYDLDRFSLNNLSEYDEVSLSIGLLLECR